MFFSWFFVEMKVMEGIYVSRTKSGLVRRVAF